MESRHILIIDDNGSIHQDFRKILDPLDNGLDEFSSLASEFFGHSIDSSRQENYALDFAYQGEDGVDMVRRACVEGKPYALVFVDMLMPPGWDGLETIRRIWDYAPSTEIVLCTAFAGHDWATIHSALPGNPRLIILTKPFDTIEIQQLASSLTRRWLLAREAEMEAFLSQYPEQNRTRCTLT